MNTNFPTWSTQARHTGQALRLAVFVLVAYLAMGLNVLIVGGLDLTATPQVLAYVASACYLIGGIFIVVRERRLRIAGALINAALMLVFFHLYQNNPAGRLSPGLATEGAQLALETILVFLIVRSWLKDPRT